MKVALCCIGRLENRYIKEYVDFYLGIGVDKIFLYDNNYDIRLFRRCQVPDIIVVLLDGSV